MKKIYSFLFIVILTAFTSCAVFQSNSDRAKNIRIGMSRTQVVQIMGKLYIPGGGMKTPYGKSVETITYKDELDYYDFTFEDGLLVEYHRFDPPYKNDRTRRENAD